MEYERLPSLLFRIIRGMKERKKISARTIFGIFMVLFYLCVSVLMVFTSIFENINIIFRVIMGVLLFMYGVFRAYRAWKELS
jgi:threonine/homoserine/homoserine lactone efflux protein